MAGVARRWLRRLTGPAGRRVLLALAVVAAWVGWAVAPPRPLVDRDAVCESVDRVTLSPDGTRLFAVGISGQVKQSARDSLRLWDAASGRELTAVRDLRLSNSQFTPDGRWLVAQGSGDVISIRDAADGRLRHRIDPYIGRDTAKAWAGEILIAPDSRTLACFVSVEGAPPVVQLWDLETGRLRITLDRARPPMAFSPDGTTLATSLLYSEDALDTTVPWLRLWDVASGRDVTRLRDMPRQLISAVEFSPDGRRLAVWRIAEENGPLPENGVSVWDLASGRLRAHLPSRGFYGAEHLRFSPDSRLLVIPDVGDGVLWDLSTDPPRNVDYLLDGTRSENGGSAEARGFPLFDQQGRRFVVPGKGENRLAVYDAATLTPVAEVFGPTWSGSQAISPDGRSLAVLEQSYLVPSSRCESLFEEWVGRPPPWRRDQASFHFYDLLRGTSRGRVPAETISSGPFLDPLDASLIGFSPDSRSLWSYLWSAAGAGGAGVLRVRQWAVPTGRPPRWLFAMTACGVLLVIADCWRARRRAAADPTGEG
jgi:WD40 repeat protein